MPPKVSVIIPCYNEPEEIFRRSLESVIGQTLCEIAGAVEIIIILDKPDNSKLAEIISEYQQRYENIIFLQPKKNLGRGKARNLGIESATGEYIAIHDADDVDERERLEIQLQYMQENPDIGVMFGQLQYMDSQGNDVETPHVTTNVSHPSYFGKCPNHTTMFIKRELLEKYGGYPDRNFLEDTELWIKMYLGGETFGMVDRILSHYLVPNQSEHSGFVEKMKHWNFEAIKISFKYGKHFLHDPYFYRYFFHAALNLLFLQFGKQGYETGNALKRKSMQAIRNALRGIS